jgi:hypothetical protein
MRRLTAVAASLVLASSLQLYAQHGGGGHGSAGGHGGGFSSHGSFSGHSAGFSGSHSSFAPRSFTHGSSSFGSSSFHSPMSRGFNSRTHTSSSRLTIHTNGFRNNCFGYPCRGYANPWGYGAFDPNWWWDNSGSDFDYDQQYQTGLANEMNQQSLDEQRMRQQGDQDMYAQSAPPRQRSEHQELNEAAPATVLVFRDEHKQEIHNYAIVGQTLWNFNPQHTQKIPLSDLDIPATTKENDEHGVDFRVPGTPVGQ